MHLDFPLIPITNNFSEHQIKTAWQDIICLIQSDHSIVPIKATIERIKEYTVVTLYSKNRAIKFAV